MGSHAALAYTTYVDGYDMTGDLNQTKLSIAREAKDNTVFGPTTVARSRVAGLEDVKSSVAGFWQAGLGAVDPQVFANLGVRKVITQATGVETDRAYFYQAVDLDYQQFGQVGEVTPFTLDIQGTKGAGTLSAGAVPGYLGKLKGTVAATGPLGTFKQLGAVGAAQFLYAAFHVFAAGTTITVLLESDSVSGFTTPTTVATIGPLTTTGGTWMTRVAGPITDDWFRFNVSAITGSFTVAAAFGIK